jgi:hypothetical protein
MNDTPKPGSNPPDGTDDKAANVGVGRRRLLRGAAGTAPVLMTLHSRPVMAGICATASASASLNPSGIRRAQGKAFNCDGALTPAQWIALPASSWPVNKSSARFRDVFNSNVFGTAKLTAVLAYTETSGEKAFARACVATYLNVLKGYVPAGFFGGGTIHTVWEHGRTGTFSPRIGAVWSVDKVTQWLATTWGEPWYPWVGHPEYDG